LALASVLVLVAFLAWRYQLLTVSLDLGQEQLSQRQLAALPAAQSASPPPGTARPAVPLDAPLDPWYAEQGEGLAVLLDFLGVAVPAGSVNCAGVEELGWRCEKQQVKTWNELLDFDRPALLSLVTEERFAAYAALVGVTDQRALLRFQGRAVERSLAELGSLWRGEFVFLWQPPPAYTGPVSRGDSGPMVAWLAQEFARLDGQPRALAENTFNADLDTRVRLFQRQFKLLDDGVVGMKTLLKLGEVRGTARALAQAESH
jgi:general secretion pathway protein A